jgi:hypothetical protein
MLRFFSPKGHLAHTLLELTHLQTFAYTFIHNQILGLVDAHGEGMGKHDDHFWLGSTLGQSGFFYGILNVAMGALWTICMWEQRCLPLQKHRPSDQWLMRISLLVSRRARDT